MKRSSLINILKFCIIALTYGVLGYLTIRYLTFDGNAAIYWLPGGLALALLLLWGIKFWPAVFVGGGLPMLLTTGNALLAYQVSIGVTLQALFLTYMLTKKNTSYRALKNNYHLLWFCLLAAIGAGISAVGGMLSLYYNGIIPAPARLSTLIHWWQGDFWGLLFCATFLLELYKNPKGFVQKENQFEFMLLLLCVVISAYTLFLYTPNAYSLLAPYGYLLFIFLIWASLRFGLHGAVICLAIISISCVYGLANQQGIFYYPDITSSNHAVWFYLMYLTIATFFVALTMQQRREFQMALEASEERMRLTLSGTGQGLYDLNTRTGEVYTNDEYAILLDYDPKTFKETLVEWKSRLHPEDKQRAINTFNDYLEGRINQYRIEFRLQKKNGSYAWILSACDIVAHDPQGKPLRVLGTHQNIDELKEAEYQLEKSHKRYKALIDNIPFAVFEIDSSRQFLSLNASGLRMLNLRDLSSLLGKDSSSFLKTNVRETVNKKIQQAYLGTPVEYEVQTLVDDREYRCNLIPLFNNKKEVYRVMGYAQDITEQKKQTQIIWQQANFDSLTSLPNRHQLFNKINDAIKTHTSFCIFFIDLDRFKEVNDTLGHNIGDALLIEAGERMKTHIPTNSLIARQGGDEFCVLLPDVSDKGQIDTIADQIIQALNAPFNVSHETLFISASIGITLYPQDGKTANELLKCADLSMYVAKNSGRNGYRYFTTSMQKDINHKTQLHNELRTALDEKQFELYFQPIYSNHLHEMAKVEVLIRWTHPTLGIIAPDKFISTAEDTGLIIDIGYFVMHQAIKQFAHWRKQFNTNIKLSINKSPLEFNNTKRNMIDDCKKLLDKYGLPPEYIIFEITENVLMESSDTITKSMLALKKENIEIALDDFGTGYSSLAYLNKLDIDYLKIDKTFITNIANNKDDAVLCEAIIIMAHKLGLKVIAEGVETKEQESILQQLHCDFHQGYYYSTPVAGPVFEAMLCQRSNKVKA